MKKSIYFKLGIFVISAFSLAVIGLIFLGAGNLLKKSEHLETYLEESVQGLVVGSPVKYRGVKIGTVQEISFVRREYSLTKPEDRKRFGRYLMIRMNLPDGFGMTEASRFEASMGKLVLEGLRIRLASQGLTGQAYLEIDFMDPEKYPALDISWKPKSPYLPAAPSRISQISSAVEKFVRKIDEAGVAEIAKNFDRLLVVSADAIEGAQVPRVRSEFVLMLQEIRETNRYLKEVVANPAFQRTPTNLEKTLKRMDRTIERLDFMLASNQDGLGETIENFRAASRDLKEVTENAKQYPSYVFFGSPPKRSNVPK